MRIKSNAKINLMLKVCEKNGNLHNIESIIVPISIYDKISITKSKKDQILGMDIPMEENIMYKALQKFRDEYNILDSYRIKIKKNIPIVAGLGGGSSNAAAILKYLERKYKVSNKELLTMSEKIGSDVSFFIYNKPCFVSGTGNIIKPLEDYKKCYGVIVFDGLKFEVEKMYSALDALREKEDIYENYSSKYFNDLELAIPNEYKDKIQVIKNDLLVNGALCSLMSGSGGTVFGLFDSFKEAKKCEIKLKNKYKVVKKFKIL